jgi:2-polyprenyl-6-methoxyphenol hydroxylase-like FAD-dependent oxidoreductase
VLIGDAAHAMPHHLTQGAGLALEDAATLRAMVGSGGATLDAGIAAYSAHRRPRIAQVVRQTQRVGAILAPRGALLTRARERAFGALAPRVLDKAAGAVAEWSPPV